MGNKAHDYYGTSVHSYTMIQVKHYKLTDHYNGSSSGLYAIRQAR